MLLTLATFVGGHHYDVHVSHMILYMCMYMYSETCLYGHCISTSPLYNSQVTESQMSLQCAFQPAGHVSITASFLGPKGDHYRQVPLY